MDIGDKSPKGIHRVERKMLLSHPPIRMKTWIRPHRKSDTNLASLSASFVSYRHLAGVYRILLAYWFRARWIKLTCRECPLVNASYVLVKDIDGKERVEVVRQVVVEKSKNVAGSERDRLLESLREKAVVNTSNTAVCDTSTTTWRRSTFY
eukprot:Em0021g193a